MTVDIEAMKLAATNALPNKDFCGVELSPDEVLALIAEVERLQAQIALIKVARSDHPKCDKYEDGEGITCGWMRVVQDIDRALEETG